MKKTIYSIIGFIVGILIGYYPSFYIFSQAANSAVKDAYNLDINSTEAQANQALSQIHTINTKFYLLLITFGIIGAVVGYFLAKRKTAS